MFCRFPGGASSGCGRLMVELLKSPRISHPFALVFGAARSGFRVVSQNLDKMLDFCLGFVCLWSIKKSEAKLMSRQAMQATLFLILWAVLGALVAALVGGDVMLRVPLLAFAPVMLCLSLLAAALTLSPQGA